MTTPLHFLILISAVLISPRSVLGQVCFLSPCGSNANCQESTGNRAICSCPQGFSGNPLNNCRRSECSTHTECRINQACIAGNCINPCSRVVCGQNANCEARNHIPVCSCPSGYSGDPLSFCRQNVSSDDRCQSPLSGCRQKCESNSECRIHETCQNFKCQLECSNCGIGAICNRGVCECPNGFIGSPYTECRPECIVDRDCPGDRPSCVYDICKNPCDGVCGTGADCILRGLTPVCSCPKDMTGDPFVSCSRFTTTRDDICNPNPCGKNAQCTSRYDKQNSRQRPFCTCRAGYNGNPLSNCSREELREDCEDNSECPDHKECLNFQCIGACIGKCGYAAICEAKRHIAACSVAVLY